MANRFRLGITCLGCLLCFTGRGQPVNRIDSFRVHGDIKVTIDRPAQSPRNRPTVVSFFAVPNGNSTEQTMGKKMEPGDDWHFDIQHIRAQTDFIRQQWPRVNFVTIYLENNYRSWPAWKQRHPGFRDEIPKLVDSLAGLAGGKKVSIYLNGHSGGGSFIFGYLAGVSAIPGKIKRISFLDSNYGYDSTYTDKLRNWLKTVKGAALNVFAYNDSVALYNGKPVVSATGGTWYRGHLMLQHLEQDFDFRRHPTDSLDIYISRDKRIRFYFKYNFNRGIYHTQQVERNGYIHSTLCGSRQEEKEYRYYGPRAYNRFIR